MKKQLAIITLIIAATITTPILKAKNLKSLTKSTKISSSTNKKLYKASFLLGTAGLVNLIVNGDNLNTYRLFYASSASLLLAPLIKCYKKKKISIQSTFAFAGLISGLNILKTEDLHTRGLLTSITMLFTGLSNIKFKRKKQVNNIVFGAIAALSGVFAYGFTIEKYEPIWHPELYPGKAK